MSAAAFANGVIALLQGDAIFQAEIEALIGEPVVRVLKSNQPVASIPNDQLPCFVIEQGDGGAASLSNEGSDTDGLVIGGYRQGFESQVDIALVWRNTDRDAAFDQRGTLPVLFVQLFLRNPQPGGIAHARVQTWAPDQSLNHPRHVLAVTLTGAYAINRS